MTIVKSYDSKCWELASYFLEGDQDIAHLATTNRLEKLALEIQQTIEDFIETERDNYEPPDPPGFEGGFAENH